MPSRLIADFDFHLDNVWSIPAVLLIGALLAEMFARRRSATPVRVAMPIRRGLTDIVPA